MFDPRTFESLEKHGECRKTGSKTVTRGKHYSVSIFLGLVVGVVFLSQGCYTAGQYDRLQKQLGTANKTINSKDQRIEELDGERLKFEEECLALKEELNQYRQNNEQADEIIANLEQELKNARDTSGNPLNLEGVSFYPPEGEGIGIRASSDVLFDSGSHTIKKSGRDVLDVLASKLKNSPGKIRIVGHTDADPVKKTIKKYPRGNIQLSAERAISVLKYLNDKGVSAKRMCILGYGEYKPLIESTSPETKRTNRRVEIEIVPN